METDATPAGTGTVRADVGRRRGRPAMHRTVDRYELPSRFADLAKRRTAGIASAWGRWGDYSLTMLCASCYLQGLEDANAAIAANAAGQGREAYPAPAGSAGGDA